MAVEQAKAKGPWGGDSETTVLALSVLRTNISENQSSSNTSRDRAQVSWVLGRMGSCADGG